MNDNTKSSVNSRRDDAGNYQHAGRVCAVDGNRPYNQLTELLRQLTVHRRLLVMLLCTQQYYTGPKITKKILAIEAPKAPSGGGCGEGRGCPPHHWGRDLGRGQCPMPGKKLFILYLKMTTFSAFWALFCTVQLHVFQVKSSALGLKNCCWVHAESKGHQSMFIVA